MTATLDDCLRTFLKNVLPDVAKELSQPVAAAREPKDVMIGSEWSLWQARDAAKALAISERMLWDLTNRGTIPCVRVGKLVRYDPDAIRRWTQQTRSTNQRR